MDSNINKEIEKIQSSIRELQELIMKEFEGHFSDGDGNIIMLKAAISNAESSYKDIELTKALCNVLENQIKE